jgi:hypothetical protein
MLARSIVRPMDAAAAAVIYARADGTQLSWPPKSAGRINIANTRLNIQHDSYAVRSQTINFFMRGKDERK